MFVDILCGVEFYVLEKDNYLRFVLERSKKKEYLEEFDRKTHQSGFPQRKKTCNKCHVSNHIGRMGVW